MDVTKIKINNPTPTVQLLQQAPSKRPTNFEQVDSSPNIGPEVILVHGLVNLVPAVACLFCTILTTTYKALFSAPVEDIDECPLGRNACSEFEILLL